MTVRQLYLLCCDHAWLEGDFVRRCEREMLGMDSEDSAHLRQRARGRGWYVSDVHLCPDHLSDAERAEAESFSK